MKELIENRLLKYNSIKDKETKQTNDVTECGYDVSSNVVSLHGLHATAHFFLSILSVFKEKGDIHLQ